MSGFFGLRLVHPLGAGGDDGILKVCAQFAGDFPLQLRIRPKAVGGRLDQIVHPLHAVAPMSRAVIVLEKAAHSSVRLASSARPLRVMR